MNNIFEEQNLKLKGIQMYNEYRCHKDYAVKSFHTNNLLAEKTSNIINLLKFKKIVVEDKKVLENMQNAMATQKCNDRGRSC